MVSEAVKVDFHLREFRWPEDLQVVLDLWQRSGPGVQLGRSDTPQEIYKKQQRDPDLFLVAESQGQVIGAVMGGYDGRRGLVYHLAVDPGCRQRGLGAALMEELEVRLRQKGCRKCYLLVTRENRTAIAFYERHGWEHMDLVYLYGKEFN